MKVGGYEGGFSASAFPISHDVISKRKCVTAISVTELDLLKKDSRHMPQVLLLLCESASSSNRGRTDGIVDGKYRVGKIKGVKMGADLGAINTANDPPSIQDLAAQRGTWKTMELLAGLLAANLIPK